MDSTSSRTDTTKSLEEQKDLQSLLQTLEDLNTKWQSTKNPENSKVISNLISKAKQAVLSLKEGNDAEKKEIENAKKTLVDTVEMINAAIIGDWYTVAQKGLKVIVGLAVVVGIFTGPVGIIASSVVSAISEIISSIIGFFKPKEESLLSQIRKVIKEELKHFEYDEVTKRKVQGWNQVESSTIQELSYHQEKLVKNKDCSYKGFNSHDLDHERELMGEIMYLAQEQFTLLAEESKHDDKKEKLSGKMCIDCIGGYASIAKYYIAILSWHKILTSQIASKSETPDVFSEQIEFLDMKISRAKAEAKMFLDFLSDKNLLGAAGWWLGKLRVMAEYRAHLTLFAAVESFRESIGCTPTMYRIDKASAILEKCISAKRSHLTPKFAWQQQNKKDSTHFLNRDALEITNNTPWSVDVFPASMDDSDHALHIATHNRVGTIQPGLGFVTDATKGDSAGFITVGKEVNDLSKSTDVYIIEYHFAMDSGVISTNYSISTLPTPSLKIFELPEKYKAFKNSLPKHDDAKVFYYHEHMIFVQGRVVHHEKFVTYNIVIEDYDVEKLIKATAGLPAGQS